MSARDELAGAERLLACECGHSLDEHNGLGCYARLSYEPLVTCGCELTDNRTHADLLAPNLERLIAAAKAEALREFAAKWSRWIAADAPQIRGGAAYRALAEADLIALAALGDPAGEAGGR